MVQHKHFKTYKQLLISLALGGFSLSAYPQFVKALYTGPIGIEGYTYRSRLSGSTAAVPDTLKSLGITEFEGSAPKGMELKAFRTLCNERGIAITSISSGYEDIVADVHSVIAQAKTLGASYVMIGWIPHKTDLTLENVKQAVLDFNRVGKICRENGITLCYHTHGYEFGSYEGGTLFDYLVQKTNPADVSFEIDILWVVHGGQNPVALINKYQSRFKLLHLKDLRKGVSKDLTGKTDIQNDVALGTGQIDLPAVLQAAKNAGIRHYYIEDESPAHSEQIPISIAYLRGSN